MKIEIEEMFSLETRKYPLRGYCLAPLEGRVNQIRGRAELRITEGRTDVEFYRLEHSLTLEYNPTLLK